VKVEPTHFTPGPNPAAPWSSTSFRESVSPSPLPSAVWTIVPTRRNSSNTVSRSSGAMPIRYQPPRLPPSRGRAQRGCRSGRLRDELQRVKQKIQSHLLDQSRDRRGWRSQTFGGSRTAGSSCGSRPHPAILEERRFAFRSPRERASDYGARAAPYQFFPMLGGERSVMQSRAALHPSFLRERARATSLR
jgi:hypothetical protein